MLIGVLLASKKNIVRRDRMRAYIRKGRNEWSRSLRLFSFPRAILYSNPVELQERNYTNLRTETMSSLPPGDRAKCNFARSAASISYSFVCFPQFDTQL